jgi:hypothetical protein
MKKVMIFVFKIAITGSSSHQPAVVVHLTLPVALQVAVINLSLPVCGFNRQSLRQNRQSFPVALQAAKVVSSTDSDSTTNSDSLMVIIYSCIVTSATVEFSLPRKHIMHLFHHPLKN